jgi:hypothetical protein
MDKETLKKIHKDIDNSSIPEEMKLMYLIANATQSVVLHVYDRIKSAYIMHGYNTTENPLLKGLNEYCKTVKRASTLFEYMIQPQINNATWGIGLDENDKGKVVAFDGFDAKSKEFVRLLQNYMNAADAEKMYKAVFTTMRRNASPNPLFENKVISHFKMKM